MCRQALALLQAKEAFLDQSHLFSEEAIRQVVKTAGIPKQIRKSRFQNLMQQEMNACGICMTVQEHDSTP